MVLTGAPRLCRREHPTGTDYTANRDCLHQNPMGPLIIGRSRISMFRSGLASAQIEWATTGRADHMMNYYPIIKKSGEVENEMFFELPASASRYLKGASLRALFDEWS